MKKTTILIINLMICFYIFGQSENVYFNSEWNETDSNSYEFKRKIIQKDSLFSVSDFNKDDNLLMEGIYKSLDPEIEQGHFKFYDDKENLKIEGNFENGKMTDNWIIYKSNGKVDKKLDYSKQPIINDKLDIKELEKNLMKNPFIEDMPTFKNSTPNAFINYINSNFIMPSIPEKYGLSGRVYIQFIIDKKGNVVNVAIQRSLHPHIECEIKRIIANAPKWRPGMNKGKLIDVPFTMPYVIN